VTTDVQNYFSETFFREARTVRRTDSTTELFFRNLSSRGTEGATDRLNNKIIFQKPFFAGRGRCDGQTQQQNYFSETFLRVQIDGATDRLNNKTIFQKPFFASRSTVLFS